MKTQTRHTASIILILLVIGSTIPATIIHSTSEKPNDTTDIQQEFVLLRGEHYLFINTSENVSEFHIRFCFPPEYGHQIPIFLELYNDTTVDIQNYRIENDTHEPNKVINFTISHLNKDTDAFIHFACWVLTQNHTFDDIPTYVKLPNPNNLPNETKIWLTATKVVQKDNLLIQMKAHQLLRGNDDLIPYTKTVASFIKNHRYFFFVLQLNSNVFFSQDALTTLLLNGENVGRSHLACALFRANNIPARVLLAHNDQGFWTQMHYMVEYYCPGYGWVLLDSTKGETPYATKRQIINRICYPEDENNTKTDYIFPLMKGEERWLWIDNEHVSPHYIDCKSGSKSQMFTESDVQVNESIATTLVTLSKTVFHSYEHHLGMNLSFENQMHFQNATQYQRSANNAFKQSDVQGYLENMSLADTEYAEIIN
ncbi:MAG: transglutaminase-like domain-containing protein [Euryarchaeota archaeon]|nr:transglutaminase-like domain-containing protein [Euryarchaeota archaeon]